eukprot:gb/GECG01004837.1/.p1 GENE.gb/GECG01004837.1/~~gb/GECG01004837.1/.p1  ORF type:complete len:267 (+),score=22.94 gb/GECG01004837.1/:1-801(+)
MRRCVTSYKEAIDCTAAICDEMSTRMNIPARYSWHLWNGSMMSRRKTTWIIVLLGVMDLLCQRGAATGIVSPVTSKSPQANSTGATTVNPMSTSTLIHTLPEASESPSPSVQVNSGGHDPLPDPREEASSSSIPQSLLETCSDWERTQLSEMPHTVVTPVTKELETDDTLLTRMLSDPDAASVTDRRAVNEVFVYMDSSNRKEPFGSSYSYSSAGLYRFTLGSGNEGRNGHIVERLDTCAVPGITCPQPRRRTMIWVQREPSSLSV